MAAAGEKARPATPVTLPGTHGCRGQGTRPKGSTRWSAIEEEEHEENEESVAEEGERQYGGFWRF